MDSLEVEKLAKKYIPNFVGVFPLNKLPQALSAPANLIVNTDTHNLPSQHWLAVSYQKMASSTPLTRLDSSIHVF